MTSSFIVGNQLGKYFGSNIVNNAINLGINNEIPINNINIQDKNPVNNSVNNESNGNYNQITVSNIQNKEDKNQYQFNPMAPQFHGQGQVLSNVASG